MLSESTWHVDLNRVQLNIPLGVDWEETKKKPLPGDADEYEISFYSSSEEEVRLMFFRLSLYFSFNL